MNASRTNIATLLANIDQPVLLNPALAAGYRIAICDAQLVRRASVFSRLPKEQRPRIIFDYLVERIGYGKDRRAADRDYVAGIEVWENKQGICGEMAYLYISMARFAGLSANYVSVKVDCHGRQVNHACALVNTSATSAHFWQLKAPTSYPLLVDIAYKQFDVMHKEWQPISDEKVWELFRSWR